MKFIFCLLFLLSGCSTVQKGDSFPKFFQGKVPDDCDFMGYVDGESKQDNPETSFNISKKLVLHKAYEQQSNAVKIININKILNKVSISAEAYRCHSLI